MKLLIYQWNSYLQHDIYEICKEKNISFDTFEWQFASKNQDEAFTKWFSEHVQAQNYDALLSINYYPVLSEVCMQKGLKYIAWCYDNPLNVERIEETLANPVNYVFLFDKMQFWKYANQGFDRCYHLPLGVNSTRLRKLKVTEADQQRFAADVSFVGNLYESPIYTLMAPLDDYTKGYLNALMNVQSKIYGYYVIDDVVTDELMDNINGQYHAKNPDTTFQVSKPALTFALASEVTRKERLILLNLCGARYTTKFYSYNDSDLIKNVIKCGPVSFEQEMPKVFACSKINLNPTLRISQTGIPLRAFDIMGAGGFLLSNYQEELLEHYENEIDMVAYESIEDAMEKIRFYMQHPDLRQRIAASGRRKTLEEHSLQQCMALIFAVVGI